MMFSLSALSLWCGDLLIKITTTNYLITYNSPRLSVTAVLILCVCLYVLFFSLLETLICHGPVWVSRGTNQKIANFVSINDYYYNNNIIINPWCCWCRGLKFLIHRWNRKQSLTQNSFCTDLNRKITYNSWRIGVRFLCHCYATMWWRATTGFSSTKTTLIGIQTIWQYCHRSYACQKFFVKSLLANAEH